MKFSQNKKQMLELRNEKHTSHAHTFDSRLSLIWTFHWNSLVGFFFCCFVDVSHALSSHSLKHHKCLFFTFRKCLSLMLLVCAFGSVISFWWCFFFFTQHNCSHLTKEWQRRNRACVWKQSKNWSAIKIKPFAHHIRREYEPKRAHTSYKPKVSLAEATAYTMTKQHKHVCYQFDGLWTARAYHSYRLSLRIVTHHFAFT